MLTVRPGGLTPPSLTVSLTVKYPGVFTTSLIILLEKKSKKVRTCETCQMNLQIHIFALLGFDQKDGKKIFQGKDGWLINAVCVAGGLLPLGREGGLGRSKKGADQM